MNKLIWIPMIALMCCLAGVAGAWATRAWTQPTMPVEAQSDRASEGIRIALLNLEEAARRSPKFAEHQRSWDRARAELQQQRDEKRAALQRTQRELQRARLEGASEDSLTFLEVELKATQETLKLMAERQEMYLAALLTKYQSEVLREVMAMVETYTQRQGYDIVLQDYTVETGGEGFFAGGGYAQTMINKPVLYAPGIRRNRNAYVTDITDAIVQQMGGMD
jgi:Skp family chaperone for outer membrane proteins